MSKVILWILGVTLLIATFVLEQKSNLALDEIKSAIEESLPQAAKPAVKAIHILHPAMRVAIRFADFFYCWFMGLTLLVELIFWLKFEFRTRKEPLRKVLRTNLHSQRV